MTIPARSLEKITKADLAHLAALAAADEADLFRRTPGTAGRYAGRLLARALCQGAALHCVDGTNGIKDFDVWSFYSALDDHPFPYRRVGTADFGPSRFGTWTRDAGRFTGRRVDLIGRSIPSAHGQDPADAILAWLQGNTASAVALRAKAVVLIEPPQQRGDTVWPIA